MAAALSLRAAHHSDTAPTAAQCRCPRLASDDSLNLPLNELPDCDPPRQRLLVTAQGCELGLHGQCLDVHPIGLLLTCDAEAVLELSACKVHGVVRGSDTFVAG